MPINKPKRQTDDLPTKILEISQRVANEEGWENLTMRRISQEIKFSLPVIYTHFESKHDLIIKIAKIGFTNLKKEIVEAINKPFKDTFDLVYNASKAYCDFAKTYPAMYQAMYGQVGYSPKDIGNLPEGQELFMFIHDSLAKLGDKKLASKDSWQLTKILWAGLHGMITLDFSERVEDEKTHFDKLLRDFVQLVIK